MLRLTFASNVTSQGPKASRIADSAPSITESPRKNTSGGYIPLTTAPLEVVNLRTRGHRASDPRSDTNRTPA